MIVVGVVLVLAVVVVVVLVVVLAVVGRCKEIQKTAKNMSDRAKMP